MHITYPDATNSRFTQEPVESGIYSRLVFTPLQMLSFLKKG